MTNPRCYILCAECDTPVAEIEWVAGAGRLVFKARHHGAAHWTVLTLADLQALFDRVGAAPRAQLAATRGRARE